mmetsp:Transcript_267/g.618  ORF Transcript_267/g.618 Transcript_267/m.618 type:complete len:117 (+) Transcript_267:75-425(+)
MATRRVLLPALVAALAALVLLRGFAFACGAPPALRGASPLTRAERSSSALQLRALPEAAATAGAGAAAGATELGATLALAVTAGDPNWWLPYLVPLLVVAVVPFVVFVANEIQQNK